MKTLRIFRLLVAAVASAVLAVPACAQQHTCPLGKKPELKVGEHQLALTNTNAFCARRNGSFRITIVDGHTPITIGDGTIKVRGKPTSDPNAPTIEGDSVAGEDLIRVRVSNKGYEGQEYRFYIEVVGVGKLDPRVRIVSPMALRLRAKQAAIDGVVKEVGFDVLGVESLEELLRQVDADGK